MRIGNERSPLLLFARRRTWPQRVLLTLLGAAFVMSALFFITVAFIAGGVLALGLALRWWWIMRRLRAAQKASAPLEGQYTVLEHADLKKVTR
ncbi:MAG: hypothetical protein ACXWCY_19145 [Burkholderiales bacterium]